MIIDMKWRCGMDFLGEFIGELLSELWGNLAEKMFNPAYSRRKRVFCFLLFYVPLAALIILFGALIYERTDIICIVISYALYALAAFLFFFLGRKAWLGRAPKEPKVIGKMGDGIENFSKSYKNTLMDKKAPLKTRIVLFSLIFAPFYALAIFIIVAVEEMFWFGCLGLAAFIVCTLIWAKRIFGKKK